MCLGEAWSLTEKTVSEQTFKGSLLNTPEASPQHMEVRGNTGKILFFKVKFFKELPFLKHLVVTGIVPGNFHVVFYSKQKSGKVGDGISTLQVTP